MNANLMDMAKDCVSPDVITKIGAQLGETPEATQKGLSSAIPVVMAGFVRQASSDPSGAAIARMLTEGQRNGDKTDDPSAMIGKGQGMLGNLFGDRLPSAVDHVAHGSGLGQKSAGKLLALAAPIVGSVVRREASARKLGPAGVASMLAEQKSAVASALGAGGLGSVFGGGAEMGAVGTRPGVQPLHVERGGEGARHRAVMPEGRPAARRMGMPILLGVLALLALLMLFGRRKAPLGTTAPHAPQAPVVQAPAPAPVMGGGPSAAVSELNEFFADTTQTTPKRIPLEGVTFEDDSDRLSAAGSSVLDGVAGSLQAHPTAEVRIEAFTDDSGEADRDKMLSANRANAVREAVIRRGVDARRITVAGNGADQPVASNDTEEGRAKNRRVELVVTTR